jgi:hypothetical protein
MRLQHGVESKRQRKRGRSPADSARDDKPPLSPPPGEEEKRGRGRPRKRSRSPSSSESDDDEPPLSPPPREEAKQGRGRPRKRSRSPSSSEFAPSSDDDDEPKAKRPRTGPSIPKQARRSRVKLFPMPEDSLIMGKFDESLPALVRAGIEEEIRKARGLVAHLVALAVARKNGEPPRPPTTKEVDTNIGNALKTGILDEMCIFFEQTGCAHGTIERYWAALESSGLLAFLVKEKKVAPEAAEAVARLKKHYCKEGVKTAKRRLAPEARLESGFAPDSNVLQDYLLVRLADLVALMEAYVEDATAAKITIGQFRDVIAAVYAAIAMSCPAMRPGVWTTMTVEALQANLGRDNSQLVASIVASGSFTAAELAGLSTIVFSMEGDKTARIYGASSIAVTAELRALLVLFMRFRAKALRHSFGVDPLPSLLFVNSAGGKLTNLSVFTREFTQEAVNYTNPKTGAPFPAMNMPPNAFRAVQTTAEARAPQTDTSRAALLAATQNHTKAVAQSKAYTLIDPRERALRDLAALERGGVVFLKGFMTAEQIAKFTI